MKRINSILCIFLIAVCCSHAQTKTTITDSIVSGNRYRNYRLYIPASYDPRKTSALIIDLHGLGSNAVQQQVYSNYASIADTANFFVVYPNGTSLNGSQFWNAGLSSTGVNDVGFISELIDHLRSQYTIDINSVYACGMSNGGFMSHTLGCSLNNKIAAIASVTGTMFLAQYNTCVPSRVVPVMQIHGTADNTVPYLGNSNMIAVDTLLKFWVKQNKCNPAPLITAVPDIDKADSCTAVHYLYNKGLHGSSCELYKIVKGGHTWPGSLYKIGVTNEDFNASEKIWLFFRKYKLNQLVGIKESEPALRLSMHPNPCTDQLTIEGETIQTVLIFDPTGKLVMQTNQKQFDVSALAKGIYTVVIISKNKQQEVKKLVKL